MTEETRWLLELHNWIVGVGRGRSTATAHYYDMMEKMIIIMMDDEGGLGADGKTCGMYPGRQEQRPCEQEA